MPINRASTKEILSFLTMGTKTRFKEGNSIKPAHRTVTSLEIFPNNQSTSPTINPNTALEVKGIVYGKYDDEGIFQHVKKFLGGTPHYQVEGQITYNNETRFNAEYVPQNVIEHNFTLVQLVK